MLCSVRAEGESGRTEERPITRGNVADLIFLFSWGAVKPWATSSPFMLTIKWPGLKACSCQHCCSSESSFTDTLIVSDTVHCRDSLVIESPPCLPLARMLCCMPPILSTTTDTSVL